MKVPSRDSQPDNDSVKSANQQGGNASNFAGNKKLSSKPLDPMRWQGALKGKGVIIGDIFSTGADWEAAQP